MNPIEVHVYGVKPGTVVNVHIHYADEVEQKPQPIVVEEEIQSQAESWVPFPSPSLVENVVSFDQIKSLYPDTKDTSFNSHQVNVMKQFNSMVGSSGDEINFEKIDEADWDGELIPALQKQCNNDTIRNKLRVFDSLVHRCFEHDLITNPVWNSLTKKSKTSQEELLLAPDVKQTSRKAVPVESWEEMKRWTTSVYEDPKRLYTQRVQALIFSYGYTLRPGDLKKTKLTSMPSDPPTDLGILDLETGQWVIPERKTTGLITVIPKELCEKIKALRGEYSFATDFLMENELDPQHKVVADTTLCNLFKGKYTATRIRKAYATYVRLNPNNSMDEIKRVAKILGHTISTQKDWYVQYDQLNQ